MTTRTDVKTLLRGRASAVAVDPSVAAVSGTAECALIGVHEVDVRLNDQVIKSDQPPMLGIRLDDVTVDIKGALDIQGISVSGTQCDPGSATWM